MTAKFTIHTFITFILISKVFALTALQGSPCYDTCDGGQQTSGADVVCLDQDFDNSTKGGILQKCLKCLQRSNFKSGTMSDSTLFLCTSRSVLEDVADSGRLSCECSANLSLKSKRSNIEMLSQLYRYSYSFCCNRWKGSFCSSLEFLHCRQ